MIATIPAPAAWPEPIAERAVLTPRGHAAVAVIRLKGQVIAHDAESRAWIVELLRDLADDLAATP